MSVAFAMAQPAEQAAPAEQKSAEETADATAEPTATAEQKSTETTATETAEPTAEPVASTEQNVPEVKAEVKAEATAEPIAEPIAEPAPASKSQVTLLHGNAYNTVENEAAPDNVNILLSKRLTKLAGQKFFYIEPSDEFGMFDLGNFFAAMDISGNLGRATAGYATSGFAGEVRIALGQLAIEGDNGKKSGSDAGDDWGLTLSKILMGYAVTLSADWLTYADQMNTEPKLGKPTEQRYRDIVGSAIVSNHSIAQKHFWSAGVIFARHENEVEVSGDIVNEDVNSNFSIRPTFNYGTRALRTEYANLYLGMNAAVPFIRYDDQEVQDSVSGDTIETSRHDFTLELTPNILGEVNVTESVLLFGEASYTWNVFHYASGTDATGDDYTTKVSKSDEVKATAGIRYQYKNWAACEFAFGDSFFTDTKSIFNGEGVFITFGGFIYF